MGGSVLVHADGTVDVELAVQVIQLVAEGLGQKVVAGDLDGVAVAIQRLHGHVLRTAGDAPASGDGQATLLTLLLAGKATILGLMSS